MRQQPGASGGERVSHNAFGGQAAVRDVADSGLLVVIEVQQPAGVAVAGVGGEIVPSLFGHMSRSVSSV
jgi:hypothetical protein